MVTAGASWARPLSCPGPFARLQRGLKQPQVVEWAAGPPVRPALLGPPSFVHQDYPSLPWACPSQQCLPRTRALALFT